jgi:7-carboxy-7-deazaguanine synthase
MTLDEIVAELKRHSPRCGWVILTGGEPALQIDPPLLERLHGEGYELAVETNGSVALPEGIDWITVSPKVAEHAIRQLRAHEVKYVRGHGQAIPKTVVTADHYLVSPAFAGDEVDRAALGWCIRLVEENPPWRLSMQQHKIWRVR